MPARKIRLAAKAGPSFHAANVSGKFQAVINATTPSGTWRTRMLQSLPSSVRRGNFKDLSERTDPEIIRPRIDLIARLELPHPRTRFDHDACHVVPRR